MQFSMDEAQAEKNLRECIKQLKRSKAVRTNAEALAHPVYLQMEKRLRAQNFEVYRLRKQLEAERETGQDIDGDIDQWAGGWVNRKLAFLPSWARRSIAGLLGAIILGALAWIADQLGVVR